MVHGLHSQAGAWQLQAGIPTQTGHKNAGRAPACRGGEPAQCPNQLAARRLADRALAWVGFGRLCRQQWRVRTGEHGDRLHKIEPERLCLSGYGRHRLWLHALLLSRGSERNLRGGGGTLLHAGGHLPGPSCPTARLGLSGLGRPRSRMRRSRGSSPVGLHSSLGLAGKTAASTLGWPGCGVEARRGHNRRSIAADGTSCCQITAVCSWWKVGMQQCSEARLSQSATASG
mmetsp:Transcript_84061/g.195494  ORF Transcript_84061/g.195494 Transcript_84061/m.195494 type:complete len:230 (-) Transcript_84061:101-790(-)